MKMKDIKDLISYFEKTSLTKMEVKYEDIELKLEKGISSINESKVINTQFIDKLENIDSNVEQTIGTELKSPLVGIYYDKPKPTEAPFVKLGDKVEKGQILCIVEAMKIMHDIKSPVSGIVKSIRCQNEATVEYDEVLFVID